MYKYFIILAFSFSSLNSFGQNELKSETHKVLGAQVEGFKVNIPFGKALISQVWDEYAKSLGKSEPTAKYATYQAVFKEKIYPKEVLLFAEITGNESNGSLWAGIDPQGVPKDTLKQLQKELKDFVYNFNIKVRTNAAQKKIDQSEQAATFLSKEFEQLKRDERRTSSRLERTNEKILRYELELIELRSDSTSYMKNMSALSIKLDSVSTELDKVKGMVELYKLKLEEIE